MTDLLSQTRSGRLLTLRVVALALVGYAYVGAVLVGLLVVMVSVLVAVPSFLAIAWVVLPLGAVGLVVARALWVRLPQPDGVRVRLDRRDAPALFELLDQLRRDLRAPKLHDVWIDGTANAAVCQTPRLGLVGPYRNTLTVGLPLLQALSREEARAVLGHELGHVSRRHGRIGAWIYRVRMTWELLLAQLEGAGHWSAALFRRFFRWYVPHFERTALALSRSHEFDADEAAARVAGAETAARALVATELVGCLLAERFWPSVWEQADHERRVPAAFTLAAAAVEEGPEPDDAARWLRQALQARDSDAATHPPLAIRLEALGLEAGRIAPRRMPGAGNAAQALFGTDGVRQLVASLDEQWRVEATETWNASNAAAEEARARLAELEAAGDWRQFSLEDMRTYAALVARSRGEENARHVWERVLQLDSNAPDALLALGQLLAARGDSGARALLERAADTEPGVAPDALAAIAGLLAEDGQSEAAAEYWERARAAYQALAEAELERSTLKPGDGLTQHELAEDVTAAITRVLGRPDIARAYLARKECRRFPERYPAYVVGIVRRGRWRPERRDASERLCAELVEPLVPLLPGPFWVVDLTHDLRRLHRRFRKLEGSRLVRRGRSSRPLARAAPVLVTLILIGGAVGRISGGSDGTSVRAEPLPATVAVAVDDPGAIRFWAAEADTTCRSWRHAARNALKLKGASPAAAHFESAWPTLRPYELALLKDLAALRNRPRPAKAAIDAAARDFALLEQAFGALATGDTKRASELLGAFEKDRSAEEAFAAIGVTKCAARI